MINNLHTKHCNSCSTDSFLSCVVTSCRQDFCHGQVMWPPLSAMQVRMAEPGHSCKQVCQEEQLICEPSFFQHLNKDKDLARWDTCTQKCFSVCPLGGSNPFLYL